MDATNPDTGRLPHSHAAPAFDLSRVLSVVRRRFRLALGVFLIVAITVAVLALMSPPRYTSIATVLINEHEADSLHLNALSPQEAVTPAYGADSAAVDTQAKILMSRSLAAQVVDQLQLDRDPEFNGALRPPGRFAFLSHLMGGGAPRGPVDPAMEKAREREGVISALLADIKVTRYELTYTIDVAVTTLEPNKAALIGNTIIQKYLSQELESKFDESSRGTRFLSDKLAQLRGDMEKADAAVQQYKIANNLLSAAGTTLTEQEISNLDTQVATARAQDAEQDARLKTAESQLARGSSGDDVGEAMGSPVIQSLRSQRAQASAHLADLQARYGDKHPEIIKAKRSLDDIDSQIKVEIQRVISNLKAQSQIAHSRTNAIVASAGETRGSLATNNRAMVRLNQLQTDDETAHTLYEGFLSRYKESLAKEGNQQADARVVSNAQLPTSPSAPNKKLVAILAIVLGLAASAAVVLLSELLKRGVSSSAEAEQAYHFPCLAEIPTLSSTLEVRSGAKDPYNYVLDKPISRFAESFRNLRAAITSSKPGAPPQVIAITSALPNEGKTTTALCLARTVALGGAKVVIVDCDLRQRSINRALDGEPKIGLLDVINGQARLRDALVTDPATGAYILPLSKTAFTPKDVFSSEAMQQLLLTLRKEFQVIILDTAPVLAVADTRVLCPSADAVVFLTRWRTTSRKAAIASLRALQDSGCYVAGVGLTQVNVREQARVGEGAGHYYRSYRKYYVG